MLNEFTSYLRDRRAKRAKYNRIVAEIEALSPRDLADLRADRTDMLRQVYREIYL